MVVALRQEAQSVNALLLQSKALKVIFRYITQTGRFKQTYRDVHMTEEQERIVKQSHLNSTPIWENVHQFEV